MAHAGMTVHGYKKCDKCGGSGQLKVPLIPEKKAEEKIEKMKEKPGKTK